MKLWGGRFEQATSNLVDEYTASIEFDQQLALFDIQGSLAHVKMLGHCKLLEAATVNSLCAGLSIILEKFNRGEIIFNVSDEDIHMNIERILHDIIGEDAGKMHIGRSRNDQVALDLHLYLRHHILNIIKQLCEISQVLIDLANDNIDVIMPGYTHLQRAEPIRFSHHLLAYFNMFSRDIARLIDSFARVNISPLGAGALAGSGVAVDCDYTAALLKFDRIYSNSLDAVSDRDFIAEFLFDASLIMMHVSKMSEEIILWSSQEFSFIQLADQFCTGSSMMPQKKNPDVAELARGKVGRVYGSLIGILTVLKALPLAYNKDLQEDKEPLFDTVKTVSKTLSVYTEMLKSIKMNSDTLLAAVTNDYSNATQLANYLTAKGIPFRQAHQITGNIVKYSIAAGKLLLNLDLNEFKKFSASINHDVYLVLHHEAVVENHATKNGTAKHSVMQQISNSIEKLSEINLWLNAKSKFLEIEL